MTTPGGGVNGDIAYVWGSGKGYGQDITEASANAIMRGGATGSFGNAQDMFKGHFAGSGHVAGEVGRLDNRIDEIIFGDGRAQLATFSTSDIWYKPPNCRKVVVDILGGSSGGGRGNNVAGTSDNNHGLGGWSGGWVTLEFNPLDLPDEVNVVVGAGGIGSNTKGAHGGAGGDSSFNGIVAGGAGPSSYGTGNKTFRIRGGRGGYAEAIGTDADGNTVDKVWAGSSGGTGSFHEGGTGSGTIGVAGNSGQGMEPGQVGMGSGGGGGSRGRVAPFDIGRTNGSGGGGGGWPSGPGGGGGAGIDYFLAGNALPGNGGSSGTGAVFVTSYLETVPA